EMTVEENLLMGAFPGSAWRDRRRALARVYELFPRGRGRARPRATTPSRGGPRPAPPPPRPLRPSPILPLAAPPPRLPPVAPGLAPVAIDPVYGAIAELKASSTTILLVEENFTHVGGIADTVHIVEMGTIVRSGSFAELSRDPTVVGTYLGSLER